MRRVFLVDTWFFIATIDRFDSHHRQAMRLAERTGGVHLLTHDAVLAEVLAFFSDQGPKLREEAVTAVRKAFREIEVAPSSGSLFDRGLTLYERRRDKQYSHVDCMSMELMRGRGVKQVLTNDHHFSQEGFEVVNDAP